MYIPGVDDGSICSKVINTFILDVTTLNGAARYSLYFNLMTILPVIVFFLLNEPHDCFTCLGKNPDHIYSIYQFTLEERAIRKMEAKYSSKMQEEVISNDQTSIVRAILEGKYNRRGDSTHGNIA